MPDDNLERGAGERWTSQGDANPPKSVSRVWSACRTPAPALRLWLYSLVYFRRFTEFRKRRSNDLKTLCNCMLSVGFFLQTLSLDKDALHGRRPNLVCNDSGPCVPSHEKPFVFDLWVLLGNMIPVVLFIASSTLTALDLLIRDPDRIMQSRTIGCTFTFLALSVSTVPAVILWIVRRELAAFVVGMGSMLAFILSHRCGNMARRWAGLSNLAPMSSSERRLDLYLLTIKERLFSHLTTMWSTLETTRNERILEHLHFQVAEDRESTLQIPTPGIVSLVVEQESDTDLLNGITFSGTQMTVMLVSQVPVDRGATATVLVGWIYLRQCAVPLAVKLFTDMATGSLAREMWAADRLAQQPRHPFILPLICHASHGARPAIVSPFMRNGNLLQYFRRSVDSVDKRKLILQVAEAVVYLHTVVGLVHGDLKCENVLVSDTGDALVADFGLSTSVEKEDNAADTSTDARILCTVNFAAPELLFDTATHADRVRSKTTESDVYAFGMLVLQAVTERLPWGDYNQPAITTSVHNEKRPMRPETGFSDAWWNVCVKCWSPKPADRPTMEAVLSELSIHTL